MHVSVVVTTRDRPRSLRACLAALEAQRLDSLDVIVVDDGSVDAGAVRAAVADSPRARALPGEGRGPAAARNLGAAASRGEVVCFTDDDCEPAPDWAPLLAARVAAGTGAAAGRTVAPPEASSFVRASQAIVEHLQLSSLDRATAALGFAPTCNLACSREAAAALPFDESYPDAAGEDRDWCARAAEAGAAPRYEARAVVIHRQRLSPLGFWRQQLRYGRGAVRFRAGAGSRRLAPPPFYAGLLGAGLRKGPAVGALVAAAQLATAIGAGEEWLGSR